MAERISKLEMLLQQIVALISVAAPTELDDDLVSEKTIKQITGLSKTTLLKLRREDKISYTTIEGKGKWYKKSDFVKLLKTNALKRT